MYLKDKTILITGASRGLGKAVAQSLWDQGANLYLVSRTPFYSDKFRNHPVHPAQRYHWKSFDLSDPKEVEDIYHSFSTQFFGGSLYALINNAGIQAPTEKAWNLSHEDLVKNMQVNFFAPVQLCKMFLHLLGSYSGGRIINLSGGGATSSRPNFSAYACAKTALVRYTEILSDELDEKNIKNVFVNAVAPGAMATKMMQEILDNPNKSGDEEYKTAKKIEHNKNTMEDAVSLINWLLSEESNGITGRLISAKWDNWEKSLKKPYVSDEYFKLRRVVTS